MNSYNTLEHFIWYDFIQGLICLDKNEANDDQMSQYVISSFRQVNTCFLFYSKKENRNIRELSLS